MAKYNENSDLLLKIKELQSRIETLEKVNPLENAAVDDGQIVLHGGQIVLKHADSDQAAVLIGPIWSGGPAGVGLLIQQEDGTDIASIRTDENNNALVSFCDGHGNAIFNSDEKLGLGKPYLDVPFYPSTHVWQDWPGTSSGTFETVYRTFVRKRHPDFALTVMTIGASGCTGEVRVLMDGSPWAGGAQSISDFTFKYNSFEAPLSGDHYHTNQCDIQIRKTSGVGKVHATVLAASGIRSGLT